MPLPLIIGGFAAIAGVAGAGAAIHGGAKMKDASDTMKAAKLKQERAVKKFEVYNADTTESMDLLGNLELSILSSFEEFSDIIEKIQRRPEFKSANVDGVDLPKYEAEELRKVSAGAGALLGGLGGAASTGTALSNLSGAALTNATLAALGGGSLATGGGGMALGSVVLGGATLGVGLLVGGIIFNVTGAKLSDKADEAYSQACKTEKEVEKIVSYLTELKSTSTNYYEILSKINERYRDKLRKLDYVVNFSEKTDWNKFSQKEKKLTENTVLFVGLLYKMCQVKLVLTSENVKEVNKVNKVEVMRMTERANKVLKAGF